MSSEQKSRRRSKRSQRNQTKSDSSKDKVSNKRERKRERKKSRKRRNISIKYENPTIPTNPERHARLAEDVESIDICSDGNNLKQQQQIEIEKYNDEKLQTVDPDKMLDEVNMKSHGLVDKKGHHKHGQEVGQPAKTVDHLWFDEVAMKQSGYVDDHGHHLSEDKLHPSPKPSKYPDRHVNIVSSVDAVNLTDSNGNSELATSELAVSLQDTVSKGDNLLEGFKYRHEYIEYRVGEKGRAMAVWPDGTEDTYDFTGDTIYQISRHVV